MAIGTDKPAIYELVLSECKEPERLFAELHPSIGSLTPQLLPNVYLFIPGGQVIHQPGCATRNRPNSGPFLAAGNSSDRGPCAGATADDEGFLCKRATVFAITRPFPPITRIISGRSSPGPVDGRLSDRLLKIWRSGHLLMGR